MSAYSPLKSMSLKLIENSKIFIANLWLFYITFVFFDNIILVCIYY